VQSLPPSEKFVKRLVLAQLE
jgi:hypothetical protein